MKNLNEHPTVIALRNRGELKGPSTSFCFKKEALFQLVKDCGADDCGFVSIDDPALADERDYILKCFPNTQTVVALVSRMHRGPVRSPNRSVSNLEFHRVGDEVNDVARRLVRNLEDRGIEAVNPAMAFPMEMENFPGRSWIVSHKIVAQAAGMGKIGIHRNLIHPKFGSFILLGTVFIAAAVKEHTAPIDYNPCVECRLCVAACPVGAIKSDGYFDFSACYTHNYQQFMGGFVNWVEDIADSKSAQEYSKKVSYSETVTRWQSLSYGPNYNSAYCLAVCPAGEEVMGPFLADQKAFVANIMTPLLEKKEPVFVVKGTDAEATLIRRFPHKKLKYVRPSGRATTIKIFLMGIRLGFQPGKAKNLSAIYHFTFTGEENATSPIKATIIIQNQTLQVLEGHQGRPDLRVEADGKSWLQFLNHEISIVRCLLFGKIKLKGSPKLLIAFGKCFPS